MNNESYFDAFISKNKSINEIILADPGNSRSERIGSYVPFEKCHISMARLAGKWKAFSGFFNSD